MKKFILKKKKQLEHYTEKNNYAISIKDKTSIDKLVNKLIFKNESMIRNKENKWSP